MKKKKCAIHITRSYGVNYKLWGKFITRSYKKICAIPITRSYGENYRIIDT